MKNFLKTISLAILFFGISFNSNSAEKVKYLKTDWSFKGLFGKFDRGALQRGYQVYTEVCASCHSMKYVSYRNLAEKGGPEFSEAQNHCCPVMFPSLQRHHSHWSRANKKCLTVIWPIPPQQKKPSPG